MENFTPKIDDALGAVIYALTSESWFGKTEHDIKLSIINKLREYGVVLREDETL